MWKSLFFPEVTHLREGYGNCWLEFVLLWIIVVNYNVEDQSKLNKQKKIMVHSFRGTNEENHKIK